MLANKPSLAELYWRRLLLNADNLASVNAIVADYPKPHVPVLPVASWTTGVGRRKCCYRAVTQAGWAVDVTSGTAAIALALQQAGIDAGDKVLLPAFHCRSMIEPFLAVGARPVYYRITEDLSLDLNDIRSKLDGAPRVLLVTHYFGFHQDMPALRALCDTHGMILIEDCAHAFFGELGGHPLGWYGDYAIASARKFFAIGDGGYLVSARLSPRRLVMESGGAAFNIKVTLDVLETAISYGRLAPLSLLLAPVLALKSWLWNKLKACRGAGSLMPIGPDVSEGYEYLDLAWTHRRMSFASRCLIRLSNKARIADRRRANYRRLAMAMSDLSAARPLFVDLPGGVVPYMFPLIVDRPELVFPVLKRKGVPLWRWDDLQPGNCEISRRYSQCLFQLPCHQALRGSEIDWMIATIREALLGAPRQCAVPVSV